MGGTLWVTDGWPVPRLHDPNTAHTPPNAGPTSAIQLPVARRHSVAQRQRCEPLLKFAGGAAAAAAEPGPAQHLLKLELQPLRRLGCDLDRLRLIARLIMLWTGHLVVLNTMYLAELAGSKAKVRGS